jgi:hypothetical protein
LFLCHNKLHRNKKWKRKGLFKKKKKEQEIELYKNSLLFIVCIQATLIVLGVLGDDYVVNPKNLKQTFYYQNSF